MAPFWVSLLSATDMDVRLLQSHFDFLKKHSIACFPEEACALLIGVEEQDGRVLIDDIIQAPNVAEDKQRYFEIDPSTRIKAEKQLRGGPLKIVGVFHSHPKGEAQPSNTDARSVIETQFVWLIAALDGADCFEVNAFKPLDGAAEFRPLTLQVTSED